MKKYHSMYLPIILLSVTQSISLQPAGPNAVQFVPDLQQLQQHCMRRCRNLLQRVHQNDILELRERQEITNAFNQIPFHRAYALYCTLFTQGSIPPEEVDKQRARLLRASIYQAARVE